MGSLGACVIEVARLICRLIHRTDVSMLHSDHVTTDVCYQRTRMGQTNVDALHAFMTLRCPSAKGYDVRRFGRLMLKSLMIFRNQYQVQIVWIGRGTSNICSVQLCPCTSPFSMIIASTSYRKLARTCPSGTHLCGSANGQYMLHAWVSAIRECIQCKC